ncbi:MAG: prepilin-type N-terminal cleavage/methylation domain-containing protein [Pirellulales bacterium]
MSHSAYDNRFGLTLLELVVVLGILAVLSTVAVRSLEPLADQARYDYSKQLVLDLREAIAGPSRTSIARNGQSVSCFVFDTGSLPSDANDLLDRPVTIVNRSTQSFDSDRDSINDVTLSSGWNGPYVTLGPGVSTIIDGWGFDPSLSESSGSLTITSYGSDGDSAGLEDGYRQDISVTILPDDYLGTVVFRLYSIDSQNGSRIDPNPSGNEQLAVLFYGVNSTGLNTGAVAEQMLVVNNAGPFEYRRSNTVAGQIAARAILWDDADSDDVLDLGETILKKSLVHYIFAQPRVETRVEMELR